MSPAEDLDNGGAPAEGDDDVAKDATVQSVLEEGFTERHQSLANSHNRFSQRMQHLDNESTQSDQHTKKMVGADASNLMEQHGLGNLITQLMAALKGSRAFPPAAEE